MVTWYKNGETLDGDQYNAATGLLTFSSILFADRGLYKCEARNFLGFDYATVEITVEGKWKIRGHQKIVLTISILRLLLAFVAFFVFLIVG